MAAFFPPSYKLHAYEDKNSVAIISNYRSHPRVLSNKWGQWIFQLGLAHSVCHLSHGQVKFLEKNLSSKYRLIYCKRHWTLGAWWEWFCGKCIIARACLKGQLRNLLKQNRCEISSKNILYSKSANFSVASSLFSLSLVSSTVTRLNNSGLSIRA